MVETNNHENRGESSNVGKYLLFKKNLVKFWIALINRGGLFNGLNEHKET